MHALTCSDRCMANHANADSGDFDQKVEEAGKSAAEPPIGYREGTLRFSRPSTCIFEALGTPREHITLDNGISL